MLLKSVFVLEILGIVLGGVAYGVLVSRLRRYHFAVWVNLGRPSVLVALSTRTSPAMGDFIWRGGYLEIEDARIRWLAGLLKGLTITVVTLFLVGAALVVGGRLKEA